MELPILHRNEYRNDERRAECMFRLSGDRGVMVGDPEGEPYYIFVQARPGAIDHSFLIFAQSEQDAYDRALAGMKIIYDEYFKPEDRDWTSDRVHSKYETLLNAGVGCVQKFDKRLTAKVPWAVNDNVY